MTREEAIDTLKVMQALQEIYRNEAVDMAIEALSEEPPYQYSKAYVEQIRGERDILQDMVDNMAKPKTGWIPCSERLPKENENVLADDGIDMFVAWYNNGWNSTDHACDPYTYIIAWMPLPEPYKGGAKMKGADDE